MNLSNFTYRNLPISFRYILLGTVLLSTILVLQSQNVASHSDYPAVHGMITFTVYLLWGFFTPVIFGFALEFRDSKRSIYQKVLLQASASFLIAGLHLVLSNLIVYLIIILFMSNTELQHVFTGFRDIIPGIFLSRLIDYWIFWTVLLGVHFYKKFNERNLKLAEMESELRRAQLNTMRMQLNPHFLFNALNTISSLVDSDKKQAQDFLAKIGFLLRGMLEERDDQFVTIKKELEFLKNYLDIEQERFKEQLEISYDIEDATIDVMIPNLILQPVVENAIKHGIPNNEKGSIEIRTERKDDLVLLSVSDNGPGVDEPGDIFSSGGIGLKNVKNRLNQIYGSKAKIVVETGKREGLTVRIEIPSKKEMTEKI